jgi:rhodanese-related sulfurtransferase
MQLRMTALFSLVLMLALAACGSQTTQTVTDGENADMGTVQAALPDLAKNTDGYVDMNVTQLAAAMPGEDFTLVNVHIPYQGELPNTDLFVPFDEITANLDQLPAQDAPIVLYCRSGSMSTQAAQALVDAGYSNVYELDGGFNAWQVAGYELLMKHVGSQR